MEKFALKGNVVLSDRLVPGAVVVVEGEKISGVYTAGEKIPHETAHFINYQENYISPGLIDLHFHGAMGKDVMDGKIDSLKRIAEHQARHGVTGFMATTLSAPMESILKAIETVRKAAVLPLSSEILGVHIEGPYLNTEQCGAQNSAHIKEMNKEDTILLLNAVRDLKAILSLAPEVGKNMSFIRELRENGVVVAVAHSNATYDQAMESFREGMTHAAHFFNALREFHAREPGIVGAVLDSDGVTAEIIADGLHVHPAAVRLAVEKKGPDKICLVTDSIKATGAGDGTYLLGNIEIEVKGNRSFVRKTGGLAGSVLTLNMAVKNILLWTGISVPEAVNMASLNPARVLGLEERMGSIKRGKDANLAIFDREFKVINTFLKGQPNLKT
jgi:N-acetylglucosamine-6-phosphate deacetylase